MLLLPRVFGCPGTADMQSGQAVQAACAAKRWLARNAASVSRIRSELVYYASTCMSLVSCLPALEHIALYVHLEKVDDLGRLVEVLAWCPHVCVLDLFILDHAGDERPQIFCKAPAFAKLRSLRRLALGFCEAEAHHVLADVVAALVSTTGLEELEINLAQPARMPAALNKLKGLKALQLQSMKPCVLEAGCLDLPMLESLETCYCDIEDAGGLAGVATLQSLTHIAFTFGRGPPFVAQLLQSPCLHCAVFDTLEPFSGSSTLGLARLPADMGLQSMALLHLSFDGHGYTQFPLAITQLVALESLNASKNDFAEVPAGITALSRLTMLRLGRMAGKYPIHTRAKRPLDARALGDLSAFPALRALGFEYCEVMLCESLMGAVQQGGLVSLMFSVAHPAPECAMMVLQLGQALKRLRRGGMVQVLGEEALRDTGYEQLVKTLAPFQKFMAAMQACGV